MSERIRGTVKWFNPGRGYGFIQREDGGKDVFIHRTAVETFSYPYLREGDEVEFEIESGPKGDQAVNVIFVDT